MLVPAAAVVEAVVGEAGALAEALCSPSTFMFLEVSTRGIPPAHRVWCCVPTGQIFYDPGGRKEGPRECMRRN